MAYNFDNGLFNEEITKYAREVFNSPPSRQLAEFCSGNSSTASGGCRQNSCSELQRFCSVHRSLGGDKVIKDKETWQLYEEFCKAFHREEEEMSFSGYQHDSYATANSLPVDTTTRHDLIRLMSAFETHRDAMNQIQSIIVRQRQRRRQKRAVVVQQQRVVPRVINIILPRVDSVLTTDLSFLDTLAEKLVSDWSMNWKEILRGSDNPANTPIDMKFADVHRYCRLNMRCRIINYIRDRFPKMDAWTRTICVKYFLGKVKSIFDVLPLLGLDILLAPDYPVNRCICKSTRINCCTVKVGSAPEIPLITKQNQQSLAEELAASDLPILIYASCLELQDVMDKPRMAYTRNFR